MVLDASAVYILLKRKDLDSLKDATTLDLAFYEVGNSLLKENRRKIVSSESFVNALKILKGMEDLMAVKNFRELDAQQVTEICSTTGLTFYDASYLALAMKLDEPLATNDVQLAAASRKLGIRALAV